MLEVLRTAKFGSLELKRWSAELIKKKRKEKKKKKKTLKAKVKSRMLQKRLKKEVH